MIYDKTTVTKFITWFYEMNIAPLDQRGFVGKIIVKPDYLHVIITNPGIHHVLVLAMWNQRTRYNIEPTKIIPFGIFFEFEWNT